MNLKQLEYFLAVAECLNFTKAAKKCFISQTAMTLQIQALEETVGVPLFVRDKHHVELTAAGKVYMKEAKEIIARSNEAVRLARTAAEGFSGNLTLGFIRGFEQTGFSETVRSFKAAYANISLELMRDNMSNLYDMLRNSQCDVIFNLASCFENDPALNHQVITEVPLMAVLYPGHPLSGRKRLTYKDLADDDFIIMQPKGAPIDEAEEVMLCYERGGFVPHIVAREPESYMVLFMVSAGTGIAILPEYDTRFFMESGKFCVVPLFREDQTEEKMNFEVCWDPENTNPAVEKFISWIGDRNLAV